MNIILVRHGESEANAKGKHQTGSVNYENTPLTKKGITQAEWIGKRLKKEKISKIYSSNLIRAKQTAEIISKINKISNKKYFDGLNEYNGKDLRKSWRLLFNKRLRDLKKLIKEISKDKDKDKTILIVAHGITNRIILGYFLELPMKRQLLFFRQDNTGVSILHWSKMYQNWHLESMNDISHLSGRLK